MFKRSHVTNGGKLGMRSYSANSFYQKLIEATGKEPEWNFNKYLEWKFNLLFKPISKISPQTKVNNIHVVKKFSRRRAKLFAKKTSI